MARVPPALEERQERLREIDAEIAELNAKHADSKFPAGTRQVWNALNEERDNLSAEITEMSARYKRLEQLVNKPGATEQFRAEWPGQSRSGPELMTCADPWSPRAAESATMVRSRALTAIERWDADDVLKASATATVERAGRDAAEDEPRDVRGVAEHVVRFSNPLYVAAFRKYARDPESFAASLTREEHAVWVEAREEQRATLGTAGAVLPSPLDPTVVLTSDGDIDPMRSVARVDSTTAKEKRYITSAGSTFSFDPELAEVSDDSFTEAEVKVAAHKGQGWIEASLEVWADQPGFDGEVSRIIADGKARLEADKFVTGSGTNEPKGIETALTGTTSEVNSAGEDLTADDTYALLQALPPRFRQNAVWQLELSTLNKLRRLFNPSGTEPAMVEGDQLIGRRFVENSNVDPYSAVDPAVTASNMLLFVGDWRNFVVLDRVGLSVAFVPPGILGGANGRPDGRVGWYAYWRVGADVLTPAAFRMLDVATVL